MESQIETLKRAIKAQGGSGQVSRRMEVKQARLCNWLARGSIPPGRIIPLCNALFWTVTPHQVRPDLYPHPLDGMVEAGMAHPLDGTPPSVQPGEAHGTPNN